MSRCFRSASLLRSHLQVQSCGRGTTVGQTTADSCATRAECSLSTKFTLYLFNTMHLVDKGRSACPAAAWGVKRAGSRACWLSISFCFNKDSTSVLVHVRISSQSNGPLRLKRQAERGGGGTEPKPRPKLNLNPRPKLNLFARQVPVVFSPAKFLKS